MESAFLNPGLAGLSKSATLAIQERSRELEEQGQHVYKFGFGMSPFPVPERLVEALRKNAREKAYLQVEGLCELREAVAGYHRRTSGQSCERDNVMVAPGSKELLFLAQMAYRSVVLLPNPGWVSYLPQAKIIGRESRAIDTNLAEGWQLDPEKVDSICQDVGQAPKLLILNSPNNPTGTTLQEARLKALADVLRKHSVIVISDEIYAELNFSGKAVSLTRYYPEGTIVSSGLSKWCGAGGWRLGTFVFPTQLAWLRKAMAVVASETYSSTCAPIQYAAIPAFQNHPDINDYIRAARGLLNALGIEVYTRLRKAGISVAEPEGGFYVFPDFSSFEPIRRRFSTSDELCRVLLEETQVALLAGVHFGRPKAELTARLAYVDFNGRNALDQAFESTARLDIDFFQKYCPNVLEGVDRICEWVTSSKHR